MTIALYKLELNEKTVSAAIIGIYLTSTLAGGRCDWKDGEDKKILVGECVGTGYFVLLF